MSGNGSTTPGATNNNGIDVFSADSHVIEPHDLWQIYTVEAYRDRAPRLIHEETTDRLVCDQARLPPIGLLAGCMRSDDEVRAKGRWDEDVPDVGWDPQVRLEALRTDGVTGEVLYPTIAMQMYPIRDVEFQWALFEAYNTWVGEFVSQVPDTFVGIGLLSPVDLERAAKEIKRCRAMGLRGMMIPVVNGEDNPYQDPSFDPLWAAAVEHSMPMNLHAATTRDPEKAWDQGTSTRSVLQTVDIQEVVLDLIFGGVFDRFPDLMIVSAENDVGWAGNLLERADYWFQRHSRLLKDMRCQHEPSHYWHNNFRVTFMRDRTGVAARDVIGTETMMWGNDFPHHVSTWPNSQAVIAEHFVDAPDEVRRAIVSGNVRRLYDIQV